MNGKMILAIIVAVLALALAEKIGISAKSVEKHLANLKADGIIQRIGPAKGGYWKVK